MSNHYYKMSKEEFYNNYKLTTEDKEQIKKSVEVFGFDEETAKGLRLNKVYEDSKLLDEDFKKNVKEHLIYLEKQYTKKPDYFKIVY